MKLLSNFLMFVLIISVITVIVTVVLEIFYFPNIIIAKILVTGIFLGIISFYSMGFVEFMIAVKRNQRK